MAIFWKYVLRKDKNTLNESIEIKKERMLYDRNLHDLLMVIVFNEKNIIFI